MELLASVSIAILLGVGGTLVINGKMSLGELVAFFSLIWYIIGPVWGLGFHINNYTQSKASGERVLEVLNQKIDVKDKEDARELVPSEVKGTLPLIMSPLRTGTKCLLLLTSILKLNQVKLSDFLEAQVQVNPLLLN